MIHGVAARRLPFHLLIKHLVIFGNELRRFKIAVQTNERRIKRWHVLRQQCLRVALRINGDEQYLHPLGISGAELVEHALHLGQRGRAHVGTVGIAEEDRHHFAFVVGQAAWLAGVVGQREIFGVVGTGDVGVFERWFSAIAGSQRGKCHDEDGEPRNNSGRDNRFHDQNPISGAT